MVLNLLVLQSSKQQRKSSKAASKSPSSETTVAVVSTQSSGQPQKTKPFHGYSKEQVEEIRARIEKEIRRSEILYNLLKDKLITREEYIMLDQPSKRRFLLLNVYSLKTNLMVKFN